MTGHAWSGRFALPPAELALRFGASLPFDCRLALHDIRASRAHASMLFAQGIINSIDHESIQQGFNTIEEEIGRGSFPWKIEQEDVHLNLEAHLTELVGEAGKRLHTARSRNDQVATSLRLWLRDETDNIFFALTGYQTALVDLAEKYATTAMPGYTHLQVAQPITVGHHLMAYYEMAKRDKIRLAEARVRINQLPLGAAALAGTSYPIDRQKVANLLGFDGVCENSLDAVSDRDFALEFSFAATVTMVHLSRLSEELILWASRGWVKLPEGYCTGSSIMPQKMNPDIPELVRGKCGRVTGHLMGLLMLMKAQPLAYNKDNQEDKEPLFDTVDTLHASLQIYAGMLPGLIFNTEAFAAVLMAGFSTATDLADYLVKKGMAFRDAHESVSKIVRHAESTGQALHNLSLDEFRRFAPKVDADVSQHLEVAHSLASRDHLGGTAPKQVLSAIARARKEMTHAIG